MLAKTKTGRIFGACLATIVATLISAMVQDAWRGLPLLLIGLMFISLWIGFYFAGVWAIGDRQAELNRKFPISSNELRKRKTTFYDWLASQGRRR
ncbi:MAG: hypothetical protein WAM04_17240 [Candidatus Sulfotelmatobacter sp.]